MLLKDLTFDDPGSKVNPVSEERQELVSRLHFCPIDRRVRRDDTNSTIQREARIDRPYFAQEAFASGEHNWACENLRRIAPRFLKTVHGNVFSSDVSVDIILIE